MRMYLAAEQNINHAGLIFLVAYWFTNTVVN